jgi:hypothetical protein
MKFLVPAALAAAILALPAPAQKLSAELRAGHPAAARHDPAPFRLAVAYRIGIGELLAVDIHAGMTIGGARPLGFSGGLALHWHERD